MGKCHDKVKINHMSYVEQKCKLKRWQKNADLIQCSHNVAKESWTWYHMRKPQMTSKRKDDILMDKSS